MGKRLRWITITYLTNKSFLLTAGLAVLWLVVTFLMATARTRSFEANGPSPPRGHLTVYNKDSLDEVRRLGMQAQVDAIDLGGLWQSIQWAEQKPHSDEPGFRYYHSPPPESFYDILDEFPNLRIVSVSFDDPHTGVRQVARLRNITYLNVGGVGLHDVSSFRSLENLERLDLNVYRPVTNLTTLAALPNLHTIVIGSSQAVTDDVLVDLTVLSSLETLVLRFMTVDARQPLSDTAIAGLGKCRSLKTLYVGGKAKPPQVDLLARVRKSLPSINVLPALVVPQPPTFVYLMPCLLAMAVGTVLASQFRNATSAVAANFVTSHAIVAGSWMLAIGLPVACRLWLSAVPAISAIILTAVVLGWALVGGVEFFINLRRTDVIRHRFKEWFHGLSSLGLMVLLISPRGAAEIIRNANAGLLVILALVALVMFSLAASGLRGLASQNLSDSTPSGTSKPRIAYRQGWMFASDQRERAIESWLRDPTCWTWWMRVERWRAGNPPFRGLRFAALFSGGAIAFAALLPLLSPRTRAAFESGQFRSQVVLLPVILLLMVCGQIAFAWRKRLQSLDVESLRPVGRKSLQREWGAALVLDVAPIALLIALIEAIGVNLEITLPETWPALGSFAIRWRQVAGDFALFALLALAASVALSALLIVIERNWLRALSAVGLIAISAAGVVLLAALQSDLPRFGVSNPRLFVAQLWWPLVVAAATIAALWKMWTRIEFDRRG